MGDRGSPPRRLLSAIERFKFEHLLKTTLSCPLVCPVPHVELHVFTALTAEDNASSPRSPSLSLSLSLFLPTLTHDRSAVADGCPLVSMPLLAEATCCGPPALFTLCRPRSPSVEGFPTRKSFIPFHCGHHAPPPNRRRPDALFLSGGAVHHISL